jgi:hypothetical protein
VSVSSRHCARRCNEGAPEGKKDRSKSFFLTLTKTFLCKQYSHECLVIYADAVTFSMTTLSIKALSNITTLMPIVIYAEGRSKAN